MLFLDPTHSTPRLAQAFLFTNSHMAEAINKKV